MPKTRYLSVIVVRFNDAYRVIPLHSAHLHCRAPGSLTIQMPDWQDEAARQGARRRPTTHSKRLSKSWIRQREREKERVRGNETKTATQTQTDTGTDTASPA